MASQVMLSTRLVISSTAQPFSAKAPVGQTCTHLPQFVQLRAWPQGRFRSHEIMERMPREATSSTCAPSTSSQTDRKSTRLNSSHLGISYAVFCFKKKQEMGSFLIKDSFVVRKDLSMLAEAGCDVLVVYVFFSVR